MIFQCVASVSSTDFCDVAFSVDNLKYFQLLFLTKIKSNWIFNVSLDNISDKLMCQEI